MCVTTIVCLCVSDLVCRCDVAVSWCGSEEETVCVCDRNRSVLGDIACVRLRETEDRCVCARALAGAHAGWLCTAVSALSDSQIAGSGASCCLTS